MKTLKPSTRRLEDIAPQPRRLPIDTPSEHRMSGRALQTRRLKLWTRAPHCAICGRLTDYPHGFELDHIQRLDQGGLDLESNCQVLCTWIDTQGNKQGCHADKTRAEGGSTHRPWAKSRQL